MKNLLYKELNLSIHKFYFILPIILGALMFIPYWIYSFVFMYFFWITIPQVFGSYNSNQDYNFIGALPVERKDIVNSKAMSIFILELLHVLFALVFGSIHNWVYEIYNPFLDINLTFFGVGIGMFGVFNVIFLPLYFKTGHFFGKPLIYANIAILIYGFIFEFGAIRYQWVRDLLEGSYVSQLLPFAILSLMGILLSLLAVKLSQTNFSKLDI
jgi:hypothetical protein